MRDLLNLLTESRGIATRNKGDLFTSDKGLEDLYFQNCQFWPENGGKYDQDELLDMIEQIEEMYVGMNIQWVNNTPKTGAIGVARFENDAGESRAFGRFFRESKTLADDNGWANKDLLDGYKLNTGNSAKETAKVKPTHILTKFDDLSEDDVVNAVANKFGENHVFTEAARYISSGGTLPYSFESPNDKLIPFKAFRDYFCEILHPLAVMSGNTTGNTEDAEREFLDGSSLAECKISFNTTTTGGLSDSSLISPLGQTIRISSKGAAGGANASVRSLNAALKDVKDMKLKDEVSDTIEILDIVTDNTAKQAPIILALRFNIINQEDVSIISTFLDKMDEGWRYQDFIDNNLLSDNLKEIYLERKPQNINKVNPHAHIIACLANKVAELINLKTSFGQDAAKILNHAGLLTVNTDAVEKGDQWIIKKFETVYPSNAITDVLFSAQKHYSSTNTKGSFVFKILKNKADKKAYMDKKLLPAPDANSSNNEKPSKTVSNTNDRDKTDMENTGREKRYN